MALESNGCPKRRKNNHKSIVLRWQNDEKVSKFSEKPTDGQNNFADTWTTSRRSTSPTAPWHQRHRYENTIILVSNDREKILSSLLKLSEQGRKNTCIPKNERVRQRPFDEALRADLGWQSQKLENLLVATFFFIILTTMVATRTPRHSMARSPRHSMARS